MNKLIMWLIVLGAIIGSWFLAGLNTHAGLALAVIGGFLAAFATTRELVDRGTITIIPTGTVTGMLNQFQGLTDEEE